jgi:hypothetical protein
MKTRIHQLLFAVALCLICGATQFAHAQSNNCASAPPTCTIDDFSTGAYPKVLFTGSDLNVQTGSMIGNTRETYFLVCHQIPCTTAENEFAQSATLQIRPKKKGAPAALILSGGYKTYPLIEVFWGVNGPNIVPLHLNLTPYDTLRVSFDGIDQVLNFNLQLYTPTGSAQLGCNLSPIQPVPPPYTVDFPLDDFVPGNGTTLNLKDVTYMDLIGNASRNYAITKYEAINSATAPPASFICTGH